MGFSTRAPLPPPRERPSRIRSGSSPASRISARSATRRKARRRSRRSSPRIPVINAGDGGHQHPTQTLTDLLTIRNLKGTLGGFTIGLCGDLKFGRTVHSLVNALARYQDIRFVFISPPELRVPDYITENLDERHIPTRKAKEDMYVLHPLPRVNEISTGIDKDPRAAYFRQVQYGVYVRMALIMTLLELV